MTDAELLAGAGLAAICVAAAASPDAVAAGPVLCPFRRLTGLPCPGCGLTRSWSYLAHGRMLESLSKHPFGPMLLAAVIGVAALAVMRRIAGSLPIDVGRLARAPAMQVLLGSWLVFGVARIGASIVTSI